MKSVHHFTNSEGIEISITIPYTSHPWWSKKVKAFTHWMKCLGFWREE